MTYFLSSFFVLLLTVGVSGFSGGSDVDKKKRTGNTLLRGIDGSRSNSVLTVQKGDRILREGDLEPIPFCNFGLSGTGDTSTCEGGPASGNICNGDWCNKSQNNCESSGGKWCSGENSVKATPEDDDGDEANLNPAMQEKGVMLLSPEYEDDGSTVSSLEGLAPDQMTIEFAADDEMSNATHGQNRKLASPSSLEYNIASYVQYERVSRGLQQLYWSADLLDEAQRWAYYMAQTRNFQHRNPLSQNINSGWRALAENIAMHWSVQYSGAHTSLMNSPGHRANILNPNMNRIGVGIRQAGNGYYYVCEIFKQV